MRWQHSLDAGEPYQIGHRLRRALDGAYWWFLGRAGPIQGGGGNIVWWFETCTDIDDQKRAELEMAEVSRREHAIAEALQGTVQPVLPDGKHDGGAHATVEHVVSSVEVYADSKFHDDVCLLVGIMLDK